MTNTKTTTGKHSSLSSRKVSALGGVVVNPNFGNGVKRIDSEYGKIIRSGLKEVLSPLDNRKKVIQDYFDLYVKSGIIDFFAEQIRKDFKIPELNSLDDYQVIPQVDDTNGDAYDLEVSDWHEGLTKEKQEKLNFRIYKTLKLLYLPRTTYDMFLCYCLYKEKLRSYPFYDMDMVNNIAEGIIPENEFLGYSKNEVEFLKASAILLLYSNGEKVKDDPALSEQEKQSKLTWIEKQMRLVPIRCKDILKNLERKNRPLRDLEMDIKIIQILRDEYRKKRIIKDIAIPEGYKEHTYEWTKTSENIIADLFPDIHVNKTKKKAAWFRKRVQQLKKKFPFLTEFIQVSSLK